MAFQYVTGTYTSPNELIDAIAEVWEFDEVDTESENHSATWGALSIAQKSSTQVALLRNGREAANFSIYAASTSTPGNFKIIKASNAILIEYNYSNFIGFLIITTATQVANPDQLDKIMLYAKPNGALRQAVLYALSTEQSFNVPTYFGDYVVSSDCYQICKYVQPIGGYKADNAYIVIRSPSETLSAEVQLDGEVYYFNRMFAIKDE
jgi:hypothetical protein